MRLSSARTNEKFATEWNFFPKTIDGRSENVMQFFSFWILHIFEKNVIKIKQRISERRRKSFTTRIMYSVFLYINFGHWTPDISTQHTKNIRQIEIGECSRETYIEVGWGWQKKNSRRFSKQQTNCEQKREPTNERQKWEKFQAELGATWQVFFYISNFYAARCSSLSFLHLSTQFPPILIQCDLESWSCIMIAEKDTFHFRVSTVDNFGSLARRQCRTFTSNENINNFSSLLNKMKINFLLFKIPSVWMCGGF